MNIQQAKSISLQTILSQWGHEPTKTKGHEHDIFPRYARKKHRPSMLIIRARFGLTLVRVKVEQSSI